MVNAGWNEPISTSTSTNKLGTTNVTVICEQHDETIHNSKNNIKTISMILSLVECVVIEKTEAYQKNERCDISDPPRTTPNTNTNTLLLPVIVRMNRTMMVFTVVLLLKYSSLCSDAFLLSRPMSRPFVVMRRTYVCYYSETLTHPWVPHVQQLHQQQQQRTFKLLSSLPNKNHQPNDNRGISDSSPIMSGGSSSTGRSNSLLLDDLLNDVLSQKCENSTTAKAPPTASTGSTTVGSNTPPPNGWKCIDWASTTATTTTITTQSLPPPPPPSPVDIVMIRDRLVYIKRDDQTRLPGSQISGNKSRKMWSLQCMNSTTFPSCIVSYGGPQSNSMLAIAAVVQYHNTQLEQVYGNSSTLPTESNDGSWSRRRFIYYTKKLPSFLRNQPSGNLFRALSLGMEIVEVSNEQYNNLFASAEHNFIDNVAPMQLQPPVFGDSVWIPQGGACGMAVSGTERMAQEIYDYWSVHGNKQPLSVCIPGGTCSTALFVHSALQVIQASKQIQERLDIEVVAIPCVGDEIYAQRQMINLNVQVFGDKTNNEQYRNNIPTILRPTPMNVGSMAKPRRHDNSTDTNHHDYYRFGEPNMDLLRTFREFRDEYDILIDLLYGAPCWTILFRHWTSSIVSSTITAVPNTTSTTTTTTNHKFNPLAPLDGRRVMYVHSGGVEGINSQLLRYKHQNLIGIDEIQLPGRNTQ